MTAPPPVLIVGGGLAGLFCALALAPRPVRLFMSHPLGQGTASGWAQGGIAVALGKEDSPEQHQRDTLRAGAGLCEPAIVSRVVRAAPERLQDLVNYGIPFDKDREGSFIQSQEAAHRHRRVVRVQGDSSGKAIMDILSAAAQTYPSIKIHEDTRIYDLIVHHQQVIGIRTLTSEGKEENFFSPAVVLATGGIGGLYAVTTNPSSACGSGIALAARAGAWLADLEFVQFHPTALDFGHDPAPLATEALRGEGAQLINGHGKRFMALHPEAELAARDVVARAVAQEIQEKRGAYLDARTALGVSFSQKFPYVYKICQENGINPEHDLMPITPAAHYHMGGVWTDEKGRTSVRGLWAIGEVASTGLHGANRLASNSLLEACVFAHYVAQDLKDLEKETSWPEFSSKSFSFKLPPEALAPSDPTLRLHIRQVMQEKMGPIRSEEGLMEAQAHLKDLETRTSNLELLDQLLVCRALVASAQVRKESRGAHFRIDYPAPHASFAQRSFLKREDLQPCLEKKAL